MIHIFFFWVVGLCVFGLSTSSMFAATTSSLVDAAHSSLAQGDVRTALIQLKKAVSEDPTNGDTRFELGALELRLGDVVAAGKDLSLARDAHYSAVKVNPLLAVAMLAQGQNEKLLSDVQPCPDDASCRSDVLAAHARAHLALHDIPNADKASREAVEALPASLSARLARAEVLMAENDNRGAENIVDGVLATDGKSAEALALKGSLRQQAGDLEEAVSRFKASLAINVRNLAVRQTLALTLVALNRNEEAATEVRLVLDKAPNSAVAQYLKAMLEVRGGKFIEALDTVRPIENSIKQLPRGTYLLAVIHAANKHVEQALDYATRFHTSEPDSLIGSKLLASLYYGLQSYNKVIDILAPIQDRFGDDIGVFEMLGSAYMAEGRIKEANDILAEAVKIHPDDVMGHARLAVAETQQVSTRNAGVHELESLLAADPKNVRVALALLYAYLSDADYDRAGDVATKMVAAQPDDPLPLTVRGSVWLSKGDETKAMADFTAALEKNHDFVQAAKYIAEIDMREERFDHARRIIDDILSRNPTDFQALIVRADIEARAGTPENMIPYLRTAIADHPDVPQPRIELMQLLASLGRSGDAVLVADDLAGTQSQNPKALDLVARTYLALKQPEKGIELYRRLQNTFPKSPEASQRLGQALVEINQPDDARTAFDRAISVNGSFIPAWSARILLEFKLKGFDAAMAIVVKAIAQNPKNDIARLLEGDLLATAGRWPEAEQSYARVLREAPSSAAAGRVFRAVLQRGDHLRAQTVLLDWLRVTPDDAEARMMLAEDYLTSDDYRTAITHYEILLKRFSQSAVILNNLAWAYSEINDSRALDTARQAYLLQPTSPEILDTYAYLLYRKGDAVLGARLAHRAYVAAPLNPQIAYHFAKVRADAKDFDAARDLLKPIVDGKVTFEQVREARELYARLGGS